MAQEYGTLDGTDFGVTGITDSEGLAARRGDSGAFEAELASVESEIELALASDEVLVAVRVDDYGFDSDMDAADLCAALASGLLSVFVSTSEDVGKWMEGVHDAASGKGGGGFVQSTLGWLLEHKGDEMDVYERAFRNREGGNAYGLFHRLLWGHDVLGGGRDNPFALMFNQKGMFGVVQAVRHLLADTFSRQGLPVPGSSYFDYLKENPDGGKSGWSHLIDFVQDLSEQAGGNRGNDAQEVYSHLLTVRAQDLAAGGIAAILPRAYEAARGIDDPVRTAQIDLVAVSVGFFGQAAVGMARQGGVPYLNNAMVPQLASAYAGLLAASNKRTRALLSESEESISRADRTLERHDCLNLALGASSGAGEIGALEAGMGEIAGLLGFLEGGQDGE